MFPWIEASPGCCQSNVNWSSKRPEPEISGRQLPPLSQSDRAFLFEDGTAVEVAVLMEVVLNRDVNGGKFLQGPDVPEFRHGTLSSSERLM
jgi:hypothetical protein